MKRRFRTAIHKKIGLLADDYEKMWESQSGKCAICKELSPQKLLCADHDHKNGKIRALLCNDCNVGLGQFRDDPARLSSALAYLYEWQTKHASS